MHAHCVPGIYMKRLRRLTDVIGSHLGHLGLVMSKSEEINLTFDENNIILSEILILKDRLAGKFGESTGNIHVILWLLEGGAVQVRDEGLSDAGCWVLLVDESESNRLLEGPAQQLSCSEGFPLMTLSPARVSSVRGILLSYGVRYSIRSEEWRN